MSFLRMQESRILMPRYFHINHPKMGYFALSVSTSMPFSISLSVFPFGMQNPKIHGFHTKPIVKPSTESVLCSYTRLARAEVTPVYKVPLRLLQRM
jgi:hypothetical protein